MKTKAAHGFTLIELVLVVAILAMIATIAVGKFGDMRKTMARKAALASLSNIQRTVNTVLAQADTRKNMFDFMESLLDIGTDGASWKGPEGDYRWVDSAAAEVGEIPGVYCGIKEAGVVSNASGVTTGTVTTLEEARKSNTGINENLLKKCGVYYLTEKEVKALENAGIDRVLLHNYTNGQASKKGALTNGFATENGLPTLNGGPGQRPDMSAFYPSILTNGSPVVVLNPATSADIYRSLGVDYDWTEETSRLVNSSNPESYFEKGVCPRLLIFGLGRSTPFTGKYFETPPRCDTLDKTEYRNYVLVFSMLNGTGNSGNTVSFAGVLTPAGDTAKSAAYNMDWAP